MSKKSEIVEGFESCASESAVSTCGECASRLYFPGLPEIISCSNPESDHCGHVVIPGHQACPEFKKRGIQD